MIFIASFPTRLVPVTEGNEIKVKPFVLGKSTVAGLHLHIFFLLAYK